MTWDLKKKGEHPMYPIQYLRKDTTTRVPNPGPTAKLVGTMAHDSIKKTREKQPNKKNRIHIVSRSMYY